MRKLTAVISAVILALVLAGAVSMVKNQISLDQIPGIRTLLNRSEKNDGLSVIVTEEEAPSSNLTYEEYIKKGDYYFDNDFYTLAANEFVRASKLEPKRAEAYLRLMRADLELGNYDGVRTNGNAVLSLSPSNHEARYLMALMLIRQSEFDKAREAFAAFSAQEADGNIRYYRILLDILNNSKSGEQPLKSLRGMSADAALNQKIDKIIAGYTEFDSAQAAELIYLDELIARGLNQAGEYEMAIQKLKTVLKERLDLRDAWIMLGFAYLNLEKYYFALTAFEKAYELDSEWPATQYFLGVTYRELGKNDDAVLYFQYAIDNRFEPQIMVKRELADLYFTMKKYEGAVKLYREIVSQSGQDVNAFVRPVWLYIDFLDNPDEAYRLAKLATQLFPNTALSYNLLGWSEAAQGKRDEAKRDLQKAIALDPKLAAAHYNLGKVYEAEKNWSEARDAFQRAYENDRGGSIGNLAAEQFNALLSQ